MSTNERTSVCLVQADTGISDPQVNLGDRLILRGVEKLINSLGQFTITRFSSRAEIEQYEPSSIALLAYGGRPQFGSRSSLSPPEKLWSEALAYVNSHTRILNIGCGTGYSLRHNRLDVLMDMISDKSNIEFYYPQVSVKFVARDILSTRFLYLQGLDVVDFPCPSLFAHVDPASRRGPLGVILIHPDRKFDVGEMREFGREIGPAIARIAEAYPDALFICQENHDCEAFPQISKNRIIVPSSETEFFEACSAFDIIISFRVHGATAAMINGKNVLAIAIDGRADLLTNLMAMGLTKVDPSNLSSDELFNIIANYIDNPVATRWDENFVNDIFCRFVNHIRSLPVSRQSTPANVVLNPEKIAALGTIRIVWTAEKFKTKVGIRYRQRIRCTLSSFDQHLVYGPFVPLPVGSYIVTFDIEFWGRGETTDAELVFDVSSANGVLATRIMRVTDVLRSVARLDLHFSVIQKGDVEFRVALRGAAPFIDLDFNGVIVERLPDVGTDCNHV